MQQKAKTRKRHWYAEFRKGDGVERLSFAIASLTQHNVATGVAPPKCLSVPGCRRRASHPRATRICQYSNFCFQCASQILIKYLSKLSICTVTVRHCRRDSLRFSHIANLGYVQTSFWYVLLAFLAALAVS